MRVYCMLIGVALVLAGPGALLSGCRPPTSADARLMSSRDLAANLEQQIANLETVNRMALTPAQCAQIRDVIASHDRYREAVAALQQAYADLVVSLERKLEAVTRDEALDPMLLTRVRAAHDEVNRCSQALYAAATDLGGRIRSVLNPDQVLVATMQAASHIEAEDILQGYRDLPDESFEREIGSFAREIAPRDGSMTPAQIEALFRDIRSLSEQEFRREHDRLLKQVLRLYAPGGPEADFHLADLFTKPAVAQAVAFRAGTGTRSRGKASVLVATR